MINALEWLNKQGGEIVFELADATTVLAHVEKFHSVTDELREYVDTYLPEKSIDLGMVRLLSGDDIIEISDNVDEVGFLLSLGYIVIGDYDNGVVLINANDATVHVLDVEALDLSRAECDEDGEEYFWDGEPIEEVSDGFEMEFEEASTPFDHFIEFDKTLTQVLKGEIELEELGMEI